MPSCADLSRFVAAVSCDALMKAATRNKEIACVMKDIRSDFTLPIRSITKDAAAVPNIPKVFARPPSQSDLYASKPAS